MTDQHLAPVCPHCGEQDCITRTRRVVCSYGDGDLAVEGAHGRHASAREDYLTDECAAAEEQREWWKATALAWHEELLRRGEEIGRLRKDGDAEQEIANPMRTRTVNRRRA